MATLVQSRRSEAEIAEIRAKRAAKKTAAAAEDGDAAVGAGASTLAYTFHAHSIAIEEDWSGDGSALAGLQWVGGATLARFFDDRSRFPEGYFAGKTVCELGAGVGLTSILLALLGAEVALTDLDCDKAVANVDANLQSQEARNRLQLIELDWYKPNMAALASPYDVLVAGDCFYEAAVIDPLLRVMWNLSSEHTEIYMCGIVGESALHAFNAAVGRYFTVERVESDEAHVKLGRRADDDDQKSRLRALMRLRRLNAIVDENADGHDAPESSTTVPTTAAAVAPTAVAPTAKKSDGIIMGPTMIRGELEVHVCRCPRLLYRELCHMFPALTVPAERLLAIPTNQHSAMELVKVGEEVEGEKDRCLIVFMEFGKHVCEALRTKGYWADYIDPCSGLPMLTPDTTKVYSEVDGMQLLLHYRTMDAGMCKVLLHPKWGSAVYPASAFTDAPIEEVREAISSAEAV